MGKKVVRTGKEFGAGRTRAGTTRTCWVQQKVLLCSKVPQVSVALRHSPRGMKQWEQELLLNLTRIFSSWYLDVTLHPSGDLLFPALSTVLLWSYFRIHVLKELKVDGSIVVHQIRVPEILSSCRSSRSPEFGVYSS